VKNHKGKARGKEVEESQAVKILEQERTGPTLVL
jgi:hypothetical protein